MSRRAVLFVVLLALGAAGCQEDGTITVHSLEFRGVTNVNVTRLKGALATRENTKVPLAGWELPWARKNNFDRGRFDADLKRIEAFYADRGYPDARVTGFDVKLNEKQDAVDVTLTIDEGEPIRIAAVDYKGFDSVPADHVVTMQRQSQLVVGGPRDRQDVITAHELAVNELRDHGYPYARVATDETEGPGSREVTIVFTADPGTLAHFGDVEIAGNNSVSDGVIRRQLTFNPGDLYRRSVVQDAQRRLYSMQLFQFVNVESLNAEQQSPQVATRVTVAEGRHQRVNFGIGYGTEEKARVDAEYRHVNFFGGARSAGARGRWSSLDRGVRLDVTQPYFFSPHMSIGADGQHWFSYTPAYKSVVTGGKVTMTHRESVRFTWALSLGSEYNSSTVADEYLNDPSLYEDLIALGLDPVTGVQDGTLGWFGWDVQYSTADSVLNARRGIQLAFHAENAGRLLPGTFHYNAMSGDARHYVPLSDRLVIANRAQFGAINADGNDPTQVPFAKKYFLGGASTIRGWGRYQVSPLGGDGLPIGGNSMFAFSSELRAMLVGNLGGVAFLDAGNVWEGDWDFHFNDLRYAVGLGLRYQTPVGPIRFDYGYQLNPIDGLQINGEPEERHWRMHFSIGQAF